MGGCKVGGRNKGKETWGEESEKEGNGQETGKANIKQN